MIMRKIWKKLTYNDAKSPYCKFNTYLLIRVVIEYAEYINY